MANNNQASAIAERVIELRDRLFGIQACVDVVRQAIPTEDEYAQHRVLRDAGEAMESLASDMELLAGDISGPEAPSEQPQTAVAANASEDGSEEDAKNIRAFLASVRPYQDCTFGKEFERGRAAAFQIAASTENPELPVPSAEQCLDVISFLSSVQPLFEKHCFGCSGQAVSCGYLLVLEAVRDIMSEALTKQA